MNSSIRIQSILLCCLFFSFNLLAQISPSTTVSSGQWTEAFDPGNTISGYETFKMYKIHKDAGNSASATEKIRISLMLGNDQGCSSSSCYGEYWFQNHLYYYDKSAGDWIRFAMVSTVENEQNYTIIGDEWDTRDSYSNSYEYMVSPMGCGFLGLGSCWSVATNSGSNGNIKYVKGASQFTFNNVQTSNNSGFRTITFDWVDFPTWFLDGDVDFYWTSNGYSADFTTNFSVNYGNEISVDNLEVSTNDNEVTFNGSGQLSTCASSSNYSEKWFAKSHSIYGDHELHEVNHGSWQNDFTLKALAEDGTSNIGPDVDFDYKLYYREYDKGCALQRVFNLGDVSTEPLVEVDNLLAINDNDAGNVIVKWSHLTSCSSDDLSYKVYRKDNPNDQSWKAVYWYNRYPNGSDSGSPYINYTKNDGQNTTPGSYNSDDGAFQFIDETADLERTYLYKIEAKASTSHQNNLSYSLHYQGTGAGINFFDDNTSLSIDEPISECTGFSFEGEQNIIEEAIVFGNEDYNYNPQNTTLKLSFLSSDFFGSQTQGESQRVYFYEDPDFNTPLLDDQGDPYEIPGNKEEIDKFDITLDSDQQSKTIYATVKARRTDGKWFSSFQPTTITGSRKPTPPPVEIYSATFEDYVTLRISNIKEIHAIDDIKIFREAREPGANSNPSTDENIVWSDDFTQEEIVLSNENHIQDLIIENGQLVWYDTQDTDAPKFSQTVLCNEYTYRIQSSNCDIWSVDETDHNGNIINGASFYQEVIGNSDEISPTLQEDLFEDGNPERNLITSRGEFSHKTHLSWNNNSSGVVDHYTIERREYGSIGESAWIEIGAVTTGEKFFEDEYCEANMLYEYRIKAHVGNCASTSPGDEGAQAATVSSNVIGFRRPVGRITGRITYNETSNPVSDVYVKVEPIINEDQTTNRSIDLSSSYALINRPFSKSEEELNEYTITFWMKSMSDQEGVLFSRFSQLYEMSLLLSDNKVQYREFSGSVDQTYPGFNLKPEINSWNSVTLSYQNSGDQKNVKLYVNGEYMDTYVSQFNPNKMDDFIFGADRNLTNEQSFDGLMDEIVLWKSALTDQEIHDNFYKFLNPIDDNLVFFIPCDEGIGEMSYDISSNTIGVYNRNHLELHEIGSDVFSIPAQMGYFFSDDHNEEILYLDKSTSSGMYDIRNIRYINDGNNFSITPYTILNETYSVIHEFLPAQRTDFLGDQSQLLSAIDFNDLTSLTVQGNLLFHVTPENSDIDHVLIDKEINPIGVKDAYVKVGGKRVNNEEGEIKTDENGYFTMSIPIGNQCISFEKNGYTFSYTDDLDPLHDDKYCTDFTFNSDPNLPDFSCNTYKELRGRVTGGNTYNSQIISDIIIGYDQPANTIGSVGFTLMPNEASVIDYNGYSVSVVTDVLSGEYHTKLLPLMHKVNSSSWISSNEAVENHYKNQQHLFSTIDMEVEGNNDENGDFVEEVMSITNSLGAVVDEYHKRHDIIYRNSPSILVTQNISNVQNWTDFVGEENIKISNDSEVLMDVYDDSGYILPWPIFKERYGDEKYRFNIEVSEVYTNFGSILNGHDHNSYMYKNENGESVYSTHSYYNDVTDGEISINNTMMQSSYTSMMLSDLNGSVDYEFNPDNPYVFGKDQGFLRKFIIEYQDGPINAIWPKLNTGQNPSTRGDVLVFGDESYGNDFFTFGPQTVDMIIRDPNGDGSYAWIEDGSTISRSTAVTNVNGYSKDWKFHVGAGLEGEGEIGFSMGAHTALKWKAKAYATLDMTNSAELKNTSENEITITETFNQTISTNQEDWEVGANGDLYIGESKNLNFGTAKDLKFIESYKCALGGGIFDCLEQPVIKQTKTYTKETTISSEGDTSIVISNLNADYQILSDTVSTTLNTLSSNDPGVDSDGNTVITEEFSEVICYQIGTQTGASIKPGTTTKFLYSQNYIQNYLLTKLAFIKNTYLFGEYEVHTDLLPVDHPCFGQPSSSTCFDEYIEQGSLTEANRYYYTIPESETEDYYEMPSLTNYDMNTLTAILGTTYEEFQENYDDADHYIGYSVTDDGINNDLWNDPLISLQSETSGFGFSISGGATPELVQFLKFVNTGPLFGTGLDVEIDAYIGTNSDIDNLSAYDSSVSASAGNEDGVSSASAGASVSGGMVDAGISIDVSVDDDTSNDGYANEEQLTDLLLNFASVQDFTSVPGFINLEELLSGLTLDPGDASESVIIPRDKVQFYDQQIKLWKRAMAMNELDKIESQFITNHSMNGGASLEQSYVSNGSYKNSNSINYDLSSMNGLGGDFSGLLIALGFEANFAYNDNYKLEFQTTTSLSAESTNTTGYYLNDSDQGDVISMDVKESRYGYGPIFQIQAGATSCPWEDANYVKYLEDFELFFELKFYDEFLQMNGVLDPELSFNPTTYDFSYSGLVVAPNEMFPTGEKKTIKASYLDYRNLVNKEATSPFEKKRLDVYNSVKDNLKAQHDSMFGSGQDYELSATTSRRDKPTLDVYPYNLYNVPEEEQAVFTLTLGNESEDNTHRIYNTKVVESSNPYGAIIKIDGASPNRDFPVLAGSTLTKTLTVEKGPDSLNYENLQLIIYAGCQYEYGTSDEYDIADTVSLNVYFLPSCTDVEIFDNDDDWLVNISDSNQVSVKLDQYNINYYSFEDVYLDYKFENEPWSPISPQPSIVNPNHIINKEETFKRLSSLDFYNLLHSDFILDPNNVTELYLMLEPKEECRGNSCQNAFPDDDDDTNDVYVHEDWIAWKQLEVDTIEYIQSEIIRLKETYLSSAEANSDNEMLSLRTSSTNVTWNLPSLPKDGNYKIRAKSNCGSYTSQSGELEEIHVYSSTQDLFSDRLQPELFGSILPVDGVLNADDDIIITFNEPINELAFNTSSAETYIEVEARKNRTSHTHDSYLYFGGNNIMDVPSGVYLNGSFTIEMWLKPESNGVLFEQSNGEDSEVIKLSIVNFDSSPALQFEYTHPTETDKNQIVSHSLVVPSFGFTHIAVAYDSQSHQIIFLDGTGEINVPEYDFNMNYVADGPISIGANYVGGMHDLRVWNKVADNIEANRSLNLSGREANLVGYWPMDELRLNPKDKARYRHAITDAQWTVDSDNISCNLDYIPSELSDFSHLEFSESVSVINNSNFTIEMWFNTSSIEDQTILSLGSWDFGGNSETWSIDINSGLIEVFQGGESGNSPILKSSNQYNDGQWHHMAMVKTSNSNTRLYIDGVEVDEISSELVGGIASGITYLGLRKVINLENGSFEYSNHFNGLVDEIRIWNIDKSHERITSEMNSNISEKIGLIQNIDFNNLTSLSTNNLFSDSNVPLIRSIEPKTSVSFQDVSNGDQISIQITEPLSKIENTSIDFTLQKVQDLSGNEIENAISWSTYVDKNQLIWEDEFIEIEKLLGESLSFSNHIINQGGSVEDFQISNLPAWLNAYPSQGLLNPNSFTEIEFIVNEDLFIGDYKEDILLTGNNAYSERLDLNLNVEALQPEYHVNAEDYEYVMNFVGKLTVEGIRSRDNKDILFAYVGEELRGATSPVFIEDYDAYFIFLSVYSNQVSGEDVEFRLWDASEGKFQSSVEVNDERSHGFVHNSIQGSFTDLAHFKATNILRQEIVLNEGWNWISFNLNSVDEQDNAMDVLQIPTVMEEVNGSSVYILKNHQAYTQYSEAADLWLGSLLELPVTDMYMMKMNQQDTIVYEGRVINTLDVPIDIGVGWNYISYLGQRIMNTNEAISSLNPVPGDVIKNKTSFSMFASESLGWLGTLNNMESGEGYLLFTENTGSLIYPESSMYGANNFRLNNNINPSDYWPVKHDIYETTMNIVATIDLPTYIDFNEENILGAFNEIFCVGNISGVSIDNNTLIYFITLYGNDGDQISFEYLDIENNKIYNTKNSIEFSSNSIIGTIDNPYQIEINQEQEIDLTFDMSVTPNPFNDEYTLEYTIQEAANIEVSLYDVIGKHIYTLPMTHNLPGSHHVKFDSQDLSKGIYFIQLRMEDKVHRKMIVKS